MGGAWPSWQSLKCRTLLLQGCLRYLKEKQHMLKTSLRVHPHNCHHCGRPKPHKVTSYIDPCGMGKTTSDKHAPSMWETAATAIFAQRPVRKSGAALYKKGPQVLIAQNTYLGYGRFNFWVLLCLWTLQPSVRGTKLPWGKTLLLAEAVTLWRIVIICKNGPVKQREKGSGNGHQVLLLQNSPRTRAIISVLASVPKITYTCSQQEF